MPIVAVFEFPSDSIDRYDATFEWAGDAVVHQPKRLHHVCYRTGDVGFVVVDVWEDEDAFARFCELLEIPPEDVGPNGNPRVLPCVGYIDAEGNRFRA